MAHQYRLGKNLQASIEAYVSARNEFEGSVEDLLSELATASEEHREAWENASDSWRDGDRGTIVNDWIDTIDGARDALDEIQQALSDFEPENLEDRP